MHPWYAIRCAVANTRAAGYAGTVRFSLPLTRPEPNSALLVALSLLIRCVGRFGVRLRPLQVSPCTSLHPAWAARTLSIFPADGGIVKLYTKGSRVTQSVYGPGTVTSSDERYTVIEFDNHGRRMFMTDMVVLAKTDEPAPAKPAKGRRRKTAETAAKR